MSDGLPPRTSGRRPLSFHSTGDAVTEINRLRRIPLKPLAKWSLPQACRHLTTVIEGNLTPPELTVPTPEEASKRDGFFAMVFAKDGMPEGIPAGKTAPPSDCTDADVDRLVEAFTKLDTYPHTHIKVGGCGPVVKDDVVKLHLAHAAHHLSFQEPVTPPRSGLRFDSVRALVDDVEKLRLGYTQGGSWSLPRMSFHLSRPLGALDAPVTRTEPTEAERQAQEFFRYLVGGGQIPQGRPMPPGSEPPADAGEAEVDALLAGLRRLDITQQPFVQFGRFGPVKLDDYKKFIAAHCAHHLAYLEPVSAG